MQTPTTRTRALLEQLGFTVSKVERWVPFPRSADPDKRSSPGIFMDQYGFADLEAFNAREVLKLQVTTMDHLADRVAKMLSPKCAHVISRWVEGPGRRVLAVGWGKYKRGTRVRPTLRELVLEGDRLRVVEGDEAMLYSPSP